MPSGVALTFKGSPIAIPPEIGSPSFLAKKHPLDVSSLSRRANSEPVSDPLQIGIRFFQPPTPALPKAFLAVSLPDHAL